MCQLVAEMHKHESWVGETHIQKCSMFLKSMLDVPLSYEFLLYKYGPYSFDLRSELAIMRARYLLDSKPHPRYAPSFILGPRGEELAKSHSEFRDEIEFVSEEIAKKDIRELERVSTVYFVQRSHPELSDAEIAKKVCELKPHITSSEALSAVDEVNRIVQLATDRGLVKSG